MKHIKKLLSILMVLTLVLSLGATALAATVTLPPDAEGHDMVAYQIFKGEQNAKSEDNQLGITAWGDGVDVEQLLTALDAAFPDAGFKTGMGAVEAAKALSELVENDDQERVRLANVIAEHVKGVGTSFDDTSYTANLGNGYWVIVDKTDEDDLPTGDDGQKESRSTVLLEVVGKDLTLRDKIDKPEFVKKVNDHINDVAGLNDVETFTLTFTLPANYGDFQDYFVKFYDEMDKGLTLDTTSFTITYTHKDPAGDQETAVKVAASTDTVASGDRAGGTSFTYTIDDLKTDEAGGNKLVAGDTVTLTYKATVNDNAVVRNYNDAYVEYSNDPNKKGGGHTNTPKSTVVVFSFFLDGQKVRPGDTASGEDEYVPLKGAKFTLYKSATETGPYVSLGEKEAAYNTDSNKYTFDFGQLGAGYYKLEESVVPEGYNKADDIYFRIEEATDTEGNVTEVRVYLKNDKGTYDQVNGTKFHFNVDVSQSGDGEGHLDEMIINTDGLHLPETGGIGTTIFYVIGAILVAGAVILLVTRKRMSGAQK